MSLRMCNRSLAHVIRIIVILTTIEATEFIKCLKRLGFYIHLKDKTVVYMYVHQITYLSIIPQLLLCSHWLYIANIFM